jgi:F0F1-type ATP synthase delta subunit
MSDSSQVAKIYAKSLFQDVTSSFLPPQKVQPFVPSSLLILEQEVFKKEPVNIGIELQLLSAFLGISKKIQGLFADPGCPEEKKLQTIFLLFPGLTLTTKAFLKILGERRDLSLLPQISEEFQEFLLSSKKMKKVGITVAASLPPDFGEILLSELKVFSKSTHILLKVNYNPKLLGGVIIESNSVALDLSVLKEVSTFFTFR